MARADLILELVKYSLSGEKYEVKKITEAIIAEERAMQHNVIANKLQKELEDYYHSSIPDKGKDDLFSSSYQDYNDFLIEKKAKKSFDDLILTREINNITQDFVEEQFRAEIIRSYGIEPRNKILLTGEPGTGKSSYAEALAEKLMLPLFIVRYDSLIGSYLGETAMRLRKLFDFICSRRCILFFDEFDTIGKERGDIHELGEIKRVVSSLLMMTDTLPSYSILIAASNHDELLDRAVWRRFQIKLKFPLPTQSAISRYLSFFEEKYSFDFQTDLDYLSQRLKGRNFGDIENFCMDVYRKYILSLPEENIKKIVTDELKKFNNAK